MAYALPGSPLRDHTCPMRPDATTGEGQLTAFGSSLAADQLAFDREI